MNPTKPHIAILCSRLDLPGGIERAVVNTANLFAEHEHRVTLVILDQTTTSFYPINAGIAIVQQPLDFGIGNSGNFLSRKVRFIRHLFRLRRLIKAIQPHVVVSSEYQFSIAARIALPEKALAVFAWEHHHFYWLNKSRFWRSLTCWIYPRLSAVVCLNPTEAELYKASGCTTIVIPNFIQPAAPSPLSAKTILTIGWLISRKGVDLIPTIGQQVFKRFPDWKWTIIGDGELKPALQQTIGAMDLAANIQIVSPRSPEMNEVYNQASLYAMTSRFECFPMVLLEAAVHGLPMVAFDCPTGPAYIINDGIDGYIVPAGAVKNMADVLIKLIEDEPTRQAFGKAARENAERFAPEKIYQLWNDLLRRF